MSNNDLFDGVQNGLTIWHVEKNVSDKQNTTFVLALFNGNIVYKSGEKATYAGVEVIDITNSNEPFSGSMTVVLNDGSISNQTFEGKATFKEGPNLVSGVGTWKLEDGTGRFINLMGGGEFDWSIDGDKYHAEFRG